jgi:hypothetical protein
MQVERVNSSDLVINQLPDGSKVIVDSRNEKVFALNATAGAAWDACSASTTLAKVAMEMQRSFNPGITEELAEEAILRLQEKNLVATVGSSSMPSRRQVLATLGAIAVPLVVSLTMADQKAYASTAGSNNDSIRPEAHISKPSGPRD